MLCCVCSFPFDVQCFRRKQIVHIRNANVGHGLPWGLHHYEFVPDYRASILLDDELGRAHDRAVPG
ncbi:hypothetical protein GBA52_014741 [Prunus armeniaca]|nr:hypothetical protein GBA52_014741 [Prunus armeniaca]